MSLFKIYGSSAGSGKTFTLTKEYLKLVLNEEDPRYFQKILAITFTNDAANEMKIRILKGLKEINDGTSADSLIFKIILEELSHIPEEILKIRSLNVYNEILHEYNDFAVKTIDSFVNQIVSSFTFDLDLPFNYEINLDQAQILSEAVDNLVAKIGKNQDLSQLILDFALNKIEDDKSWNTIVDDIKVFGKNIFENEGSYLIEKNLDLTFSDIQKIRSQVTVNQKTTLKAIKELAQSGLDLIYRNGLVESDFFQRGKGAIGFFQKLAKEPEELFFSKSIFPNSYQLSAFNEGKYYSKAVGNFAIVESIKEELTALANQILDFKTDKYYILSAVMSNLLKIPLLAMIDEEISQIKADRNEVFLSEFNKKILDIVVKEPVPFIYERIGEKYDHLLIDEFQDTSSMQFFNLLPLIDNSIAKNKYNLIVGDPKQAIYKWRGGNIQLMIDLINKNVTGLKSNIESGEGQHDQIENVTFAGSVENLNTNYRSKSEIIGFNNSFFESVVQLKSEEWPLLAGVFSDYFQNSPPIPKHGGFVGLEFLEKKEESVLEKLLVQINQIISEGYSPGDIAILCRKNDQGSEIATFLENNGFEINSADSLKIWKNAEIGLLVSALKFIHHPENTFARFELLQFYGLMHPKVLLNQNLKELCALPLTEFLKIFDLEESQIAEKDFYTLTEYFIEKFDLLKNKKALNYIFTFLDLELQFFHKKSKNLSDFLAHWELKKEKFSISNNSENAITVTTLHKSKGLEYPIVILPYLTWDTKPRTDAELWMDISTLNYAELKAESKSLQAVPLKIKLKDKIAFGKDILENYTEHIFIENLNMLYVALTRPIDRLYIWCHYTVNEKGWKVEGLGEMFKSFLETNGRFVKGQNSYSFGEESTNLKMHAAEIKGESFGVSFEKVFEHPFQLKLKTESNFRSLEREKKITLGNLVHAAFELIITKEDVDFAIKKLSLDGLLTEDLRLLLIDKINQVIENEELSLLYSKRALVKNEVEIFSKGQSIQRPDRIVFVDDKVYVIDYKAGEKSKKHIIQIQNYGKLLGLMGYSNIHLLIIYLEPFEIVKVSLLN